MCSNYFTIIMPNVMADDYAVESAEFIEGLSLYPYRPAKSGLPAKPYNLAPVVVRQPGGRRTLERMRWGLLPPWAKTDQEAIQPFNAQAEGVDSKPMFRSSFQERRCLVPAHAFYEFKSETNGKKTRYRFGLPGHGHFAFAGLFNVWQDTLLTMTFITTAPTAWYGQFHNRQPAILTRDDYDRWLDPLTTTTALKEMLQPWAGEFEAKAEPK